MKKTKAPTPSRSRASSASSTAENLSIVIPVLNESKTIGDLVAFALKNPLVGEVLVVDDGSHDGTPELAAAAGPARRSSLGVWSSDTRHGWSLFSLAPVARPKQHHPPCHRPA